MNNILQTYARDYLKKHLLTCSSEQQRVFKLMYSPKNLELPIDEVVSKIPADKLDWAMQQVARTMLSNLCKEGVTSTRVSSKTRNLSQVPKISKMVQA